MKTLYITIKQDLDLHHDNHSADSVESAMRYAHSYEATNFMGKAPQPIRWQLTIEGWLESHREWAGNSIRYIIK